MQQAVSSRGEYAVKRKVSCALAFIAAAGIVACSDNNIYEPESSVPETTAETVTEATTEVQTADPTAEPEHGKLRPIWGNGGITLKMDGEEIQFAELESVPTAEDVSIADYNFDGYEDIFIPDNDVICGMGGDYWLYDPEKNKFELSQELALVDGRGWRMDIYNNDQLCLALYGHYGSTKTYYQWQGSSLVPVRFLDIYFAQDDSMDQLEDAYEYDENGERYMVSRTFINISNGARYKTIDSPRYFRVTDDSVLVMQGREVLQTIEGVRLMGIVEKLEEYKENAEQTPEMREFEVLAPEHYLLTSDFNFDGENDLGIRTDTGLANETLSYDYYVYDPDKKQYVIVEEISGKSHMYDLDSEDKSFWIYDGWGWWTDDEYDDYRYQWQDGKLKPIEWLHTYSSDGKRLCDCYEYDENGNAVFVRTGVVICDNFSEEDEAQ